MSYGTLVIVDGVYRPAAPHDDARRRGIARLTPGEEEALLPRPPIVKTGGCTLDMEINCTDRAYLWGGDKMPYITDVVVEHKKTIRRLSTTANPIASAKRLIAEYAGYQEAAKFRGRAIALSRIHSTISGEVFRFALGGR